MTILQSQSIKRCTLSMRFIIVPGHTAVVGVCWAMMPSRSGKNTCAKEVDHG
jgi:hypothetical protein